MVAAWNVGNGGRGGGGGDKGPAAQLMGTLTRATATGRRRCQISNSIKSLSFIMNGGNLIQLDMKKCGVIYSQNNF